MGISARFGRPGVIQVSGGSRSSSRGVGGGQGLIDIVETIQGFRNRAKTEEFLKKHKVNTENMTSEHQDIVAKQIQQGLIEKKFGDVELSEQGKAEQSLINLFQQFRKV